MEARSTSLAATTLLWGLGWALAVLLAVASQMSGHVLTSWLPAALLPVALVGVVMALLRVVLHRAQAEEPPGDAAVSPVRTAAKLLVVLTAMAALLDFAPRAGRLGLLVAGCGVALGLWMIGYVVPTARALRAQGAPWPQRLLLLVPFAVFLVLIHSVESG